MLRNQRGMSLVEIMIVLTIIASVAAMVVTNVNSQLKKADIKQTKIIIKEISKALDMYYTDCNNYPTTDEGLNALLEDPGSCRDWGPDPYLSKMPEDAWGNELIYEVDGGSFILISLGADKREGGSAENKDINSQEL